MSSDFSLLLTVHIPYFNLSDSFLFFYCNSSPSLKTFFLQIVYLSSTLIRYTIFHLFYFYVYSFIFIFMSRFVLLIFQKLGMMLFYVKYFFLNKTNSFTFSHVMLIVCILLLVCLSRYVFNWDFYAL